MEQKKLIRWGAFVGFLVLASASCLLTERSYKLIFPNLQEWRVWGLAILFFILASIGTALVVNACNHDKYIEHRRPKFWFGIIMVTFFWLVLSLPTNIHTLFYDSYVGNVAQHDIVTTSSYLSQISTRKIHDAAYDSIYNLVTREFDQLSREFNGHDRSNSHGLVGNGRFTREKINNINNILNHEGLDNQPNIRYDDRHSNSTNQHILTEYGEQMNNGLTYLRTHKYTAPKENVDTAASIIRQLNLLEHQISTMDQIGKVDDDIVMQTCNVLNRGYSLIKSVQQYVVFANDAEKEYYTSDNPETLTKRMLSPLDVMMDFFAGKYPLTFALYIIFSILIDLGAFIFFDIAFRKE